MDTEWWPKYLRLARCCLSPELPSHSFAAFLFNLQCCCCFISINPPYSRNEGDKRVGGVPLRECFNNKRSLLDLQLLLIRKRKASLCKGVTESICFCGSRAPPPIPLDAVSPARSSKPNMGLCQHWLALWVQHTGNRPARRIGSLCFFSTSRLQSWSSRQIPPSWLYTVVALQPVCPHIPCGTLAFDPRGLFTEICFYFVKHLKSNSEKSSHGTVYRSDPGSLFWFLARADFLMCIIMLLPFR